VVKTTIYLDEDLTQSLRVISKRRSRPQAELIREALRKFTVAEKPALPEGMGMFDSGHTASRRRTPTSIQANSLIRTWVLTICVPDTSANRLAASKLLIRCSIFRSP